jgi:hypothetical protein
MSVSPSALFGNVPITQPGVCAFGVIGQCSTVQNNIVQTFNQSLTEKLTSNTTIKNTAAAAVMTSTQNISFSNMNLSGCSNVNFSNIHNTSVLDYNFNMISKNITQTQFNDALKSSIDGALKSDAKITSEAFSGGSGGTINNVQQNYNNTVTRLVNSFTYTDFTKLMTTMSNTQSIGFNNISFAGMTGGTCNFSDISNDSSIKLVMSIISETVSKEFVKIMQENAAKTSTASTTTTTNTGVIGDTGRAASGVITAAGQAGSSVITAAGGAVATGVGGIVQGALTGLMLPLLFLFMVIIFIAVAFSAVNRASNGGTVPTQETPQQN